MKLFLTSNGLKGKLSKELLLLLTKKPQDCSVAFITTSAYGEGDDITWLEAYRKELRDIGFLSIEDVDLRNMSEVDVEKVLSEKDVVFVNGGNTFFLLYYVKKSGFDRAVKKFLQDGKLYVGVSAGSIICGQTIETAALDLSEEFSADKNDIGLTDISGMSYLPFLISPHYEETQRDLLMLAAAHASRPILALTNTQAVRIIDNEIEVVGGGAKLLFKNGDPSGE